MKTKHFFMLSICVVAVPVLILTVPAKSQGNSLPNNDTDDSDTDQLLMPVDTRDYDFAVKYKGVLFSLKKLLQLLRHHNITVLQNEKSFLDEVLNQKQSPAQSCKRRCFLEERSDAKECYCDKACKTWGDCCLDFYLRCGTTENRFGDASLENTCGDINHRLWSGAIVKHNCGFLKPLKNKKDCQTVRQLNMTLEQEIPVFDWDNNMTYRSLACARCNNGGNLSFWGLRLTCLDGSQPPRHDINAVKTFVTENEKCSWKYEPFSILKQRYKSCMMQDSICAKNQLPVMSAVKILCSSYSMVFSVDNGFNYIYYRNPHCALCDPEGRKEDKPTLSTSILPPSPPLTILLDVSSNILNQEVLMTPQLPTQHYNLTSLGYNLTSQALNCSSLVKNCTVSFGGKA